MGLCLRRAPFRFVTPIPTVAVAVAAVPHERALLILMVHQAERSPVWTKSLHRAIFDEPSGSSTPSPQTTLDGYVTASLSTPLSAIEAMTSPSTDVVSFRSTAGLQPRLAPAPLRLQPVQPHLSPVSAASAQSPACSSVTSTSCRRSLGSEMGLTPRQSTFAAVEEDVVDEQEASISVEMSEEGLQDHLVAFDGEQGYKPPRLSTSSAPVTPTRTQNNTIEAAPYVQHSTPSRTERQIVLIEMDEERPYEEHVFEEERGRLVSILPSLGSPFAAAHDPYLPCSEQHDPYDGVENVIQETYEPLAAMQPYQPYHPSTAHYLEPVEEVTEEATLADFSDDCTHGIVLYEHTFDRSAASSSTTRQSTRDRTANATDTAASTATPHSLRSGSSTPSKAVSHAVAGERINMREWEQLHGLGTPSSTLSSPGSYRFGWAEVIASVPPPPAAPVVPKRGRSLPRLSSNNSMVSTSTTRPSPQQRSGGGVARMVCSPERLLGLQSSFWITSPVTLTLGQTLRNARLMERTAMRSVTMPSTPLNRSERENIRLSIESARSLDESGWAHVTSYPRKDKHVVTDADKNDDNDDDDENIDFYHHNDPPGNIHDQQKGKAPHRWTQRWTRMATSHSATLSSLRSAR